MRPVFSYVPFSPHMFLELPEFVGLFSFLIHATADYFPQRGRVRENSLKRILQNFHSISHASAFFVENKISGPIYLINICMHSVQMSTLNVTSAKNKTISTLNFPYERKKIFLLVLSTAEIFPRNNKSQFGGWSVKLHRGIFQHSSIASSISRDCMIHPFPDMQVDREGGEWTVEWT